MNYLKLLPLILLLCSCSDSDDGSFDNFTADYEVYFHLDVVDEQGNSLLDSNNPDNILEQGVTMTYNGVEYPLVSEEEAMRGDKIHCPYPQSRLMIPFIYGIYYDTERDKMYVGDFWAGTSIKEEFTISWGDGTPDDKFEFRSDLFRPKNKKPYYKLTVWMNGKKSRFDSTIAEFKIVRSVK
ncbi:MAG: hypothetical protein HFJ95_05200 [Muribaculaceae bacterium]|nr:hypothetical protein [Muribaculaceae bacterium]